VSRVTCVSGLCFDIVSTARKNGTAAARLKHERVASRCVECNVVVSLSRGRCLMLLPPSRPGQARAPPPANGVRFAGGSWTPCGLVRGECGPGERGLTLGAVFDRVRRCSLTAASPRADHDGLDNHSAPPSIGSTPAGSSESTKKAGSSGSSTTRSSSPGAGQGLGRGISPYCHGSSSNDKTILERRRHRQVAGAPPTATDTMSVTQAPVPHRGQPPRFTSRHDHRSITRHGAYGKALVQSSQ